MPHIIVEHSEFFDDELSMGGLVERLHEEAMTIDAFPIGGLRVRSLASGVSRIGDGDAKNGFIYITVRIGEGRDIETKRNIGERLFKVLTDFTQRHFDTNRPLSLGLELQVIEKAWTWKKNNIHKIIKDKS